MTWTTDQMLQLAMRLQSIEWLTAAAHAVEQQAADSSHSAGHAVLHTSSR